MVTLPFIEFLTLTVECEPGAGQGLVDLYEVEVVMGKGRSDMIDYLVMLLMCYSPRK